MSVQVILLWIAKYPSQLLTVRIRIQLNWAKRYEIEESCATNCCFWAWFWNYNILSLDTATREPVCTYIHKLDSPQGSVTLTLQMDVTPKFLRTHMQSLKQGFSSSNVNEPCRYRRSALLSVSCKYQFLYFLNCQDGVPDTSTHLAHCLHTAEAAKVPSLSWTNIHGQKWDLSLAAATCLALGRIYIFRWMSPVNKMWVFHMIAVVQIWGFGLHPCHGTGQLWNGYLEPGCNFAQRAEGQGDTTIQPEAYLTLKFVTTNSSPVNLILNWKENNNIFMNLIYRYFI